MVPNLMSVNQGVKTSDPSGSSSTTVDVTDSSWVKDRTSTGRKVTQEFTVSFSIKTTTKEKDFPVIRVIPPRWN